MRSRSRDGSSCARGTAGSACRWTSVAISTAAGSPSAARRSAVSIPRSHRAGTAGGASRPRRTCSTTLCSPTSSRTASRSSALRRRTNSSMSAPTTRSRSSSRTTDVLYVTVGDPRRRTGGNIYAQHMLAALRRSGIRARTLALDARSAGSLRDQRALVSAIASVPGATLDLVGDADGPYAARVRRLLVHHGLARRVRVHANLGGAALERRYRSAGAFVLPSVRESYGMALASALAHGLP